MGWDEGGGGEAFVPRELVHVVVLLFMFLIYHSMFFTDIRFVCENGGTCDTVHTCKCTDDYQGDHCTEPGILEY